MASEVESSHLLFPPKTKDGSTPLRFGRHDIPLGISGYTNQRTVLIEEVAVPRKRRIFGAAPIMS
jgi:hypothetical protein